MKRALILSLLMLCALFLHTYKMHSVPPGFNADEAAYGYNAYSILKTGADEYGNKFPLRLISFGDYKLPGYTYLTVPFVALLGLSETATRLPSLISALLLIPAMYLLSKQFFNERIALITAFLTTFSPWVHILARHAHEAVPTTLLIVLSLIFLLGYAKQKNQLINGLLFILFISLSLFTYHIARIIYVVLMGFFLFHVVRKRDFSKGRIVSWIMLATLFIVPFILAEIHLPPERIKNLFIFSNSGIQLITDQMKIEFAHSPFSTKLFVGLFEIFRKYITYFSIDFLAMNGDPNVRFGFPTMAPITIVEYLFFLSGVFYVYRYIKEKNNFLILALLFIAPLPAALTWLEEGFNRVYFMIVPILLLSSYGIWNLWESRKNVAGFKTIALVSLVSYLILVTYVWNFYFFHYPLRATTIRSWQCGYKQLVQSLNDKYSGSTAYVTSENGQPYIFLLFYQKYMPSTFIHSAKRTTADKYGFTQVIKFDRFSFSTDSKNASDKKTLYVLSQAESQNEDKTNGLKHLESIQCGTEDMFELYESTTVKTNQTR